MKVGAASAMYKRWSRLRESGIQFVARQLLHTADEYRKRLWCGVGAAVAYVGELDARCPEIGRLAA